jgi:hypothetical protein
MSWQWTATGPSHALVDVAVEHAIEGVGAGRGQAAADHGSQYKLERRDSPGRQKHSRHSGHQEKLDNAGLGESQVCRDNVASMTDLPATASCPNPKINTGYLVVVGGGHST